jgi:hypothetical protein
VRTIICAVCGKPLQRNRPNIKYHVRCRDQAKYMRDSKDKEPVPEPVVRPDSHYRAMVDSLIEKGIYL